MYWQYKSKMSNKLYRHKKKHTYFFCGDIINVKNVDPKIKSHKKDSYLLHCIYNDQRFEICKN